MTAREAKWIADRIPGLHESDDREAKMVASRRLREWLALEQREDQCWPALFVPRDVAGCAASQ